MASSFKCLTLDKAGEEEIFFNIQRRPSYDINCR
jgi:hypothetical protein